MRSGCGASAAIPRSWDAGSHSKTVSCKLSAWPHRSSRASSPAARRISGCRTTMYNPRAFGNHSLQLVPYRRALERARVARTSRKRAAHDLHERRRDVAKGFGPERRLKASPDSSGRRSSYDRRPTVRRRSASSSSARSGFWRRSPPWSSSSRVRTSPTCSWRAPQRASARWPSACRSAPAEAG